MGDPVITWILVKGAGKDSIGEDPHAGGAQHGCAQLFAESSGIFTVLGVGIEELFVAGGVETGNQGDGPGNLGEREHQLVGSGELVLRLPRLNDLREPSRGWLRRKGRRLGAGREILGTRLRLRLRLWRLGQG